MPYDANNTKLVVGPDGGGEFHTTNVSDTFLGSQGYDVFNVGSSERLHQADFFFGTDTYNGISFETRMPDYDSYFLKEIWFDSPPMGFGGSFVPSNARVIDAHTLEIDGRNVDFASQFEGVYVYSGGVEIVNGVASVPEELARFNAIVSPEPYEDYGTFDFNQNRWVSGVGSVPGEYYEPVDLLAEQFQGFAVYSNLGHYRQNLDPDQLGQDYYTQWRADGEGSPDGTLTASMPDPYSFYFYDDVTDFWGTDLRDVFYGNPNTDWSQFHGGGGIDIFFGTETGREVLGREQSSVYLSLDGTEHLFDRSTILPDNVDPFVDATAYWSEFGFSISGNIVEDFDGDFFQTPTGEMVNLATVPSPESFNLFTEFDVFRGSDQSDILVGGQGFHKDFEFRGEGGDDILIGGMGFETLDGGAGNDIMDFGGNAPRDGGQARYRINVSSSEVDDLNFKIVSEDSGVGYNRIEVYKGSQLLETFKFDQKELVDYEAAFNDITGQGAVPDIFDGLYYDGLINDVGDFNQYIKLDAETRFGSQLMDVVTAEGRIDDRDLRTASADTLINATEIQLAVVDKDTGEWFKSVEVGVDNDQKLFFAKSSGVENTSMSDPYVVWTQWEDWRGFGSDGSDTFILQEFVDGAGLVIDPYNYGLDVSDTWGRVDLGAGDDILNAAGVNGNGFEIIDGDGSDTYLGSANAYETLVYTSAPETVVVDAQEGVAYDGRGGFDSVSNIDQFRLTSGNDIFRASYAERTDVVGMAGDDIIIGAGNAVYSTVRYDQEHFDTNYEDGYGVVVNLSGSNISYIQQGLNGDLQGGIVEAYTAKDTFGDTDTFAVNDFGERVANVYGSRYHNDVLIGGDEWNSLRGKGGDDYLDGGSGGGDVTYMWDDARDARSDGSPALETRGIIANLSEYDFTASDVNRGTGNLFSAYNYTVVPNYRGDELLSGTVVDAYGYFDTVKNVNKISATVESDIVFSGNLAMPESTYGTIYSDVDLGAGNDLLIGDADTAGAYRRVSYGSAEDVYNFQPGNYVPDPSRGLDIDLANDQLNGAVVAGRIEAAAGDTAQQFVDKVFGGRPGDGVRDALYDAATMYFETVQADKGTLEGNFAYVIPDPFVHTDYIFNTTHFAGTSFADKMQGDNFDNQLQGLGGDDFIYGAGGDDFLRGDHGADILAGGLGQDLLRGGAGDDSIVIDLREYLATGADFSALTHKELATGDGGFDVLKLVVEDSTIWGTDVSLDYADARFDPISFEILFDAESSAANVETMFWNFERIEVYKASEFDFGSSAEIEGATLLFEQNLAESIENAEVAIGGELNDNIVAGDQTRVVFSQDGDDHVSVWGYHSDVLGNNLRIDTGAGDDYIRFDAEFKGTASVERDANNVGIDTVRFNVKDIVDLNIVERTTYDLFSQSEQNVWDAVLQLDDGSTVTLKEALSVDASGNVDASVGSADIISLLPGDIQIDDYWAAGNVVTEEALVFNTANFDEIKTDAPYSGNLSVVSFGTAGADGTGLAPINLALEGGAIGATYFALDGDDVVIGTAGNDRMYGGDGDDYLEAADGDDRVYGGAGDDTLSGGRGDNVLDGGDGSDDYRVGLNDGGIQIQETSGQNDQLTLEVSSPSDFNWNDTFETVAVENGTLNMVSRAGNLNIQIEDFVWGADTVETIALADEGTGQLGTVFKTSANGQVDTSDSSDYLLVANEAYANNTLSGTSDQQEILALQNVYDENGNLVDAEFTNINLDDLIEVSVDYQGYNYGTGENEFQATINIPQGDIGHNVWTEGAVEISGGGLAGNSDGYRESVIMTQSDARALLSEGGVVDPAVGGATATVTEAQLYSKSIAMLPGTGIESEGYNLGSRGEPFVSTVGGAGNDVIFGLDNEVNTYDWGSGEGNKAAGDLILANAGDDTIIAGGGVNMIVGGAGSDTVYLDNKAQKTVVYGDKVGRSINNEDGNGGMHAIENIDPATGEKAPESDTVNLNFTRDQVRINKTNTNTWVVEFDANATETSSPIFDKTSADLLDDIFVTGNANASFDATTDSIIELNNIENLILADGSFEIGSKGSLRVDIDYDADRPVIELFKEGGADKFRIVTPARTEIELKPDLFTVSEDTMGGRRGREVIMPKGTEIEAEPYFDENGENPVNAVENADGSWLLEGQHKAELVEKEIQVEVPASSFKLETPGVAEADWPDSFKVSDFDSIEWIGASDGVSRFTRIFDLAAKNITSDKDLFGSDEYGMFYADAEGDVVNYVTGVYANEETTADGTGIIVGDIIVGTDNAEIINAGIGDDIVIGKGGDDVLIGSAGNDVLLGGIGDDVLLDADDAGIAVKEKELQDARSNTWDFNKYTNQFEAEAGIEEELALLSDPSDDILVGGQGFDQIDGNGGQDFVSAGDVTVEAMKIVDEANAADGVDDAIFDRIFVYEDTLPE